MEFQEITSKEEWNKFVLFNPHTDILQSWEWGETKKIEGWKPYRFGVKDGLEEYGFSEGELLVGAQVLVKKYKFFGKLAYIPHGPVFITPPDRDLPNALWKKFERGLIKWAKKNRIFTVELEPKATFHEARFGEYRFLENWKITKRNRQPKYKLIMDITQSEKEILAGMKKNTRYNVRYAKRKGVKINKYDFSDPSIDKVIDRFYDLVLRMQERAEGYPVRPKKYFQNLVEQFKGTKNMMFIEAEYDGDVVAMNISQFTKFWASSFYAGSIRKHSKKKPPYLLRWASILEAKERGCDIYDFWGIVPDSKHHKGYSKHKLSFGGDRIDFVGVLIYPLSWKARLWEIAMWIQKKKAEFKWS
ncbi:peptidoglycan bridge formation glycyltransferase FemA/FemB family protein [Candidatus Dojkabacteria bacterium]|nr:peptidoglycan bridge formation glycyltransferase FemA/FemB family protein [Candidatus Dojkabacteria bacterium]